MTTSNLGRKSAPAKLKLLNGVAPGRDSGGRRVAEPPRFARYAPAKPDDLSSEASRHWDEIVPELARLELINPSNAGALIMLCETWSRWKEAQAILFEEGVLGHNSQGSVRHPAVAVIEAASKEYRAWSAEFGLTPSSETRLGAKEPKGDGANPFAPRESGAQSRA